MQGMIKVSFKNLEKSDLIRNAVIERVESLCAKFPALSGSTILVTVEMENSPFHAGADLFGVKLHILNGRFRGVTIRKADANLYCALAEVIDASLELLNRNLDRRTVRRKIPAKRLDPAV